MSRILISEAAFARKDNDNLSTVKLAIKLSGLLTLSSMVALVGISIWIGFAQSGHSLDKNTRATCDGESLRVCFEEAGLGNLPANSAVEIRLSGSATSQQQCFTRSGNEPQAENKPGNVRFTSTATSPVSRSGGVTGCLTSTPPETGFSCPPGQVLRSGTTYSNITLTDTTTGATTTAPGTVTCSRS